MSGRMKKAACVQVSSDVIIGIRLASDITPPLRRDNYRSSTSVKRQRSRRVSSKTITHHADYDQNNKYTSTIKNSTAQAYLELVISSSEHANNRTTKTENIKKAY